MSDIALSDPILARLKTELTRLYGPRLKQVLLYGSRARGDHREDSDYDVLVVLEGPFDLWDEIHRLSELSSQLLWDTLKSARPVDASFKPVTAEQVQARTGFMHNVRKEAVPLLSPEAVDYFAKAERALERAREIAKAGFYDDAARNAYTATLSAARGLIFDKTGISTKTHSGTRSQLFHLIEEGLRFDPNLARFLSEGFDVKQIVDYEIQPSNINRDKAEAFVKRAADFIAVAKAVIEGR